VSTPFDSSPDLAPRADDHARRIGGGGGGAAGPAAASGGERRPRARDRRTLAGVVALTIGCVCVLLIGLTPSPYVLRQPGPVFDALGTVPMSAEDQTQRPVITIEGAPSYDHEGRLDVMTVNVAGSPDHLPTWFEAFIALLSPDQDVVPVESVFGAQTTSERNAVNTALMVNSTHDAVAAALAHEGYAVPQLVRVDSVVEDGPSAGILQPGDVVVRAGGAAVTTVDDLRAALERAGTTPVELVVRRGDADTTVAVTPREQTANGETRHVIGIVTTRDYDFPVDVRIDLGDVGGPSAGLIFALSVIDRLEANGITNGAHIAGTGTMSPDGQVGPIGGIRQKLHAAADAGADFFLAPADNCVEAVRGGAPASLPVYAVSSLDEALGVVRTVTTGGDASSLRTCLDVAAQAKAAATPAG